MSQTGIQLHSHIRQARLAEGGGGAADALTHIAHRVPVAGDQQHRQAAVHAGQILGVLVEGDAVEHLAEQPHRGIGAAEGVGNVAIHVLRVRRQPVIAGAVGSKGLVVAAEGQIVHQLAGRGGSLCGADHLRHGTASGQLGLRLPAGTHDNGGPQGAGIADQVAAGQKGAHAVAHEAQRHTGKLPPQLLVQQLDVRHHRLPRGAVAKVDGGAALRQRAAVAQMVVAHHGDPLLIEIAGKAVVAADMLGYTVGNLQHGTRRSLRQPLHGVELSLAVAGEKGELGEICHGNFILPMVK